MVKKIIKCKEKNKKRLIVKKIYKKQLKKHNVKKTINN